MNERIVSTQVEPEIRELLRIRAFEQRTTISKLVNGYITAGLAVEKSAISKKE